MGGARGEAGPALKPECAKTTAGGAAGAGPCTSRTWPSARGVTFKESDRGPVAAQSSGQRAEAVAFSARSPPSGSFPSTKRRAGLQQQWPSSTQQVIEQMSDDWVASNAGAEKQPEASISARHAARSLTIRFCTVSAIAPLVFFCGTVSEGV
jgi:hypothetical protein